MSDIGCKTCMYNSHLLHKDLPFGCFNNQAIAIDTECFKQPQKLDKQGQKTLWDNWKKNHPNWKGTPHIVFWYYCETQKDFDEFIKMYPDVEHAPNESWKSMYETLTLK